MVVLSCDVLTLALKLYIPVYIWLSLMSLLHSHGLASELISLESSWKLVASLQLVFVSVSLKSQLWRIRCYVHHVGREVNCFVPHSRDLLLGISRRDCDTCSWAYILVEVNGVPRAHLAVTWLPVRSYAVMEGRLSYRSSFIWCKTDNTCRISRFFIPNCLVLGIMIIAPNHCLVCIVEFRETSWCDFDCNLVFLYEYW